MKNNNAMKLVPRDCGSLAALHELGDFAVRSSEIANRIFRFLEVGAPIFRCEVDQIATESTGNLVAIYEPSNRLNAFLAALRTGRERDLHDPLEVTTSHDASSTR